MNWRSTAAGCLVALLLLSAAHVACRRAGTSRYPLQSPNPLDRARAAVAAAEQGDPSAVHGLVDLLNDRDAGVRLYAINALERLCGTTYGYEHYAPLDQRRAAIERWRDALRAGELTVSRREASAAGDPGP